MASTTRAELVTLLVEYAGDDYVESQYDLIEAIVADAIEEVRNARYPFGDSNPKTIKKQEAEVLARYRSNIRSIAEYHYDKIGKRGVTTFYESGQTTSWESGGTPRSFFTGIIPLARCMK